ncbi:MAG: dTDP-glucose 4,6-dehydratase [Candidatus Amulumruptor caecigallinarius]|nr:dTDP-glucose 4,6-dehydratase [Candidatus Amulumruptor caecigallinarius]MCM1395892.1 dTDP-glucose 4,6-dehydratase [Candidatus Amulumruptor caecigallinarius]MCM1452927.1 dTDP-glucose 4,6-dehydratase [bacterium]
MKKYLVTGAAGFIGANFVKYLLKKWGDDVDIVILDALTYAGNPMTIAEDVKRANVRFVKGDIGDRELVSRLMAEFDPDYVVNFAAESHVDRSIENPRLFLETNILGTQNMLDCAREAWLEGKDEQGHPKYRQGKKYLQISTDEVYGSLSKDYDEAQPLHLSDDVKRVVTGRTNLKTFGKGFFTEETPLAPRSPYSAAKTGSDLITLAYHETYGMPVNITRCSNNYGPYHFPEKLIPLIIKNILEGKKLPVYGKGDNVRDWLYVEDHAKAIDMVLRDGRLGEVYNIGGFNEEQNINIVRLVIDTIARIMKEEPRYQSLLKGIKPEEINYDLITYVTDRPGHDMRYAIDPTKIATELGWYPETPFTEGIEKTIRWYLDNQEWVEGVTSGDYQRYYEQMYGNR